MANYKVLATWDISIQNLYKDITLIQQGISCKLNISLRSISRVTVNYKVGNEYVTDLCTIDLENNKVIVPFKKNVLEVGKQSLELVCHMKNSDVLVTPTYIYDVIKSLDNTNDITEEDAYPVLIGMIQELTKNEAIIQANEEARANAEMYRELHEDERQNSEAERKRNENTRISNENARKSNENSRQQYEAQRRVEEDERLTEEQVRVNAENIRIANENERLRKEIERQNAEELRQIAYNSSLYARMDVTEDRLDAVDSQLIHIENISTYISVKNFGAKGDGKTDDTEAIQAAFDYMNVRVSSVDSSTNISFHTVFFPKGIYNISRPINIYNRARIVGERSIIRSSAEWCIDHPQGYYGGTIGWQTEISHMIFLGKNGVRLNTRQGDETSKANLDYGHIYFHDCIFNNEQGYAFVGDVQSCLLKFDMCLINGAMDVLCDDFVMDTCWCNWKGGYNVQEFITFKGSKMYIDKCMFIPYSGNVDASKEHAWVGIYDYTVPSGHQGMSFAVIDRCNFGGEASGLNVVNCKTSTRINSSSQTSGVRILNSALALTQYAVRCFELPDTINIEGCRGVGGLNLVGLCDNFDKTKLDTLWGNLGDMIRRMNINWRCENNSLRLIESSNKVRSYFCNELLPIVNIRNFQRNYMNGTKLRLIPNTHEGKPYLVENYIRYVDDAGQLWIRIPDMVFPRRHYNNAATENYRFTMHRFKVSIIARNSTAGTFGSYSKNIWDYTFIVCMAEQATNQSIRIIEDNVFKSNYQNSTIGQIIDSKVIVNDVEYPTNLIPGDGHGHLNAIELAISGVGLNDYLQVIIHDMDLFNYEEI